MKTTKQKTNKASKSTVGELRLVYFFMLTTERRAKNLLAPCSGYGHKSRFLSIEQAKAEIGYASKKYVEEIEKKGFRKTKRKRALSK